MTSVFDTNQDRVKNVLDFQTATDENDNIHLANDYNHKCLLESVSQGQQYL
jgi:hypothetical protein